MLADLPDALYELDLNDLEDATGSAAYGRGVRYARQGVLSRMRWDPDDVALIGTVRGQHLYRTTAYFAVEDGKPPEFGHGECSCPVGVDCKHVVALVLTALGAEYPPSERDRRPVAASWEQSLSTLLGAGAGSPSGTVPLAIEVTLSARGSPYPTRGMPAVAVHARPVRRGRNGWVAGGLTWGNLGSMRYQGDYLAEHVELLQQLHTLYQLGSDRFRRHGVPDKSIDLTAFDSQQLWPLLDEASAVGLRLVHGRKQLGAVDPHGTARLHLDMTRTDKDGPLAVTPVVRVDGSTVDPVPVGFIGTDGHGVIYVDRAELREGTDHGAWRLRVARLAESVPSQLQRMALEGDPLEVPAADHERFRSDYYPRLRRLAPTLSSDESFVPPEISAPTLVLRASYGSGHHLDLRWEWAYQVDDVRHRVVPDADPSRDGYRDPAAEETVVASLDAALARFGLVSTVANGGTPTLARHVELRGVDTMRFSTEVLPLLAGQSGVTVEIDGDPADYREASDSLSIGVSTTEIEGETDWFDLGISVTVEGREVPFVEVFVALAREQSHMLLADGAYFSLDKPELRRLRGLIEEARALQESSDGTLRISRFQAGLWDELTELGVVDRQALAWQRQVLGLLSVDALEAKAVPDTLIADLRPYQVDGFRWLAFLWEHQLGGILADDMGLGKTLQSLALICHARRATADPPPFLIVAPTSVVSNWAGEAERFAPDLAVTAVSDTLRRAGRGLDEVIAGAEVVVTSYTLFRLDFDAYAGQRWSGLVLDEAQYVKNHQSKAYQCARRLPAAFKLAITGTPMENNLMELWSLLSITAPGLFPHPVRFRDFYARPIEKEGDTELLAQLRRRIRPLITRRTKEQVVAELPAKQEQVLEVDLHPQHRKLYQTRLQRERQKVLGLVDDMNRNRFTILRSLTVLRQLSLHAGLVDDEHADLPSAKIDTLLEQLRDVIYGGHRALVFSQFTGFLERVRARLDADGVEYCYLDGRTRNRAAVLRRFTDGTAPVFLISLKAGGFGLNLTQADYCFLLDPWWNPATEAQAVDRIHRIGQVRNVMVYRLIARDTIEDKVMALKARKAELFASVMDDGDVFGSTLDADDIRGLLA